MSVDVASNACRKRLEPLERIIGYLRPILAAPVLTTTAAGKAFRYSAPDVRHLPALLKAATRRLAISTRVSSSRERAICKKYACSSGRWSNVRGI